MKGFKKINLISKILIKLNQIFRVSELVYIYLFINVFFLLGCASLKQNDEVSICANSSIPCLESTEYVLLLTNCWKHKNFTRLIVYFWDVSSKFFVR